FGRGCFDCKRASINYWVLIRGVFMFGSKSTGGFYHPEIHGSRLATILDPDWIRPKVDIVVQPGESALIDGELIENTGDESITIRDVPDMNAMPDLLEVANPAC